MSAVLITGADGYLGTLVARKYLDRTDMDVVAAVRAADQNELTDKKAAVAAALGEKRVKVVPADLRDDDPLAAAEEWRSQVSHVVHSAANIRFDVDEQTAEAVNVRGAASVWDFARRCPKLEAVALLSTVYATGLQGGRIREEPSSHEEFANFYERSKWRAEQQLLDEYGDLPQRVLRVATAIADDDGGAVTQYNAFHQTLKLCFYGLTSVVPGNADTPLYFVTGDMAAQSVVEVMADHAAHGVFHVAHTAEESMTVQSLLDVAFDEFNEVEEFRRKRILLPLLADRETFEVMRSGMAGASGSMVTQALDSMSSFAPQLYVTKLLDNQRLRDGTNYRSPDCEAVVRNACRHLVSTRWGRRAA